MHATGRFLVLQSGFNHANAGVHSLASGAAAGSSAAASAAVVSAVRSRYHFLPPHSLGLVPFRTISQH
ncbi:hypothetical protein ACFX2I_014429 [Malus domestica]